MKILVDVSRCPMARIYNKAPSQSLWPIRMSLWLNRDVTLPLMKSYPFVLRLRWSSPRGLEKVSVLTEPGRFGNKVPVLWTWKEVTFVVLPSSCFFSCHHWLCPGEISQWPNCKWKRDSSLGAAAWWQLLAGNLWLTDVFPWSSIVWIGGCCWITLVILFTAGNR